MKSVQFHIRESYYKKLHFLMKHFPHHYKYEWKFVDDRLIQPRIRRMNENRDFALEPLPKNLPFNGIEPKFDLRIDFKDDRAESFQKLLRYHGYQNLKGKYENSRFVEVLIHRAFEKLKKTDPELAKRFDVESTIGQSHNDENWFGKND